MPLWLRAVLGSKHGSLGSNTLQLLDCISCLDKKVGVLWLFGGSLQEKVLCVLDRREAISDSMLLNVACQERKATSKH